MMVYIYKRPVVDNLFFGGGNPEKKHQLGQMLRRHPQIWLPETNIAPENKPSQKEISSSNHPFQVLC